MMMMMREKSGMAGPIMFIQHIVAEFFLRSMLPGLNFVLQWDEK